MAMIPLLNQSITLTLTTDWNRHDYYLGVLRGRLLSACPQINVVEITNMIPSFNLNYAAFVLKHSFKYYPEGTIHLNLVNSEGNKQRRLLAFNHAGYYFIVPDNGIIGLLLKEQPEKVYAFDFNHEGSFGSLEAVVEAVTLICQPDGLDACKHIVTDYDQLIPLLATIEDSAITGSIIYIDSYDNVVTNVTSELFERIGLGKSFDIYVQSLHNRISKLVNTYNQVDEGELLALFNSAGLLELAINNGRAAELLSLSLNSSIRIKFYD